MGGGWLPGSVSSQPQSFSPVQHLDANSYAGGTGRVNAPASQAGDNWSWRGTGFQVAPGTAPGIVPGFSGPLNQSQRDMQAFLMGRGMTDVSDQLGYGGGTQTSGVPTEQGWGQPGDYRMMMSPMDTALSRSDTRGGAQWRAASEALPFMGGFFADSRTNPQRLASNAAGYIPYAGGLLSRGVDAAFQAKHAGEGWDARQVNDLMGMYSGTDPRGTVFENRPAWLEGMYPQLNGRQAFSAGVSGMRGGDLSKPQGAIAGLLGIVGNLFSSGAGDTLSGLARGSMAAYNAWDQRKNTPWAGLGWDTDPSALGRETALRDWWSGAGFSGMGTGFQGGTDAGLYGARGYQDRYNTTESGNVYASPSGSYLPVSPQLTQGLQDWGSQSDW